METMLGEKETENKELDVHEVPCSATQSMTPSSTPVLLPVG